MISIGGVQIRDSQVNVLDPKSPLFDTVKTRSMSGVVESVPLSVTHRYLLRLQSLDRDKYTELYKKLVYLESTANGKITIDMKGEIRSGLTHLAQAEIPATLTFDFDITAISPTPNLYYDLTIPLEVYEAI